MVISLIWIFSLSITIININNDIIKILFFVLGSGIGSYLGSILEEKIAMGTNILICITKSIYSYNIKMNLNKYKINTITDNDKTYSILLILLKRKEINNVSNKIKKIDNNSILISGKIKSISNID